MSVRPFVAADIPQVVDLYWRFMRQRQGSPPVEFGPLFHKLYFENPWADPAFPSLVYEGSAGEVVGFLGIIPRRMSLCGQPIRVAFGGNFLVRPGSRSKLAAPRLLGVYLGGNYDAWQTDSANDISRKLLERLGFRTIPALNLHWIRPLRPAHYGVYALTRGSSRGASSALKIVAKPFCGVADFFAAKSAHSPFHQRQPRLQGSELTVETLYQCLLEIRRGYSLWAEYDVNSLQWLLDFMDRGTVRGRLRKILVRNNQQEIAGWYIYYVNPGGIGEVVQIGSSHKSMKGVLEHLFHDAWEQGVIGLHGVVDRRHMADFSDKGCLFTCRGGWNVAFTRNQELVDVLERGDSFLTRLDGEWCLDPGE